MTSTFPCLEYTQVTPTRYSISPKKSDASEYEFITTELMDVSSLNLGESAPKALVTPSEKKRENSLLGTTPKRLAHTPKARRQAPKPSQDKKPNFVQMKLTASPPTKIKMRKPEKQSRKRKRGACFVPLSPDDLSLSSGDVILISPPKPYNSSKKKISLQSRLATAKSTNGEQTTSSTRGMCTPLQQRTLAAKSKSPDSLLSVEEVELCKSPAVGASKLRAQQPQKRNSPMMDSPSSSVHTRISPLPRAANPRRDCSPHTSATDEATSLSVSSASLNHMLDDSFSSTSSLDIAPVQPAATQQKRKKRGLNFRKLLCTDLNLPRSQSSVSPVSATGLSPVFAAPADDTPPSNKEEVEAKRISHLQITPQKLSPSFVISSKKSSTSRRGISKKESENTAGATNKVVVPRRTKLSKSGSKVRRKPKHGSSAHLNDESTDDSEGSAQMDSPPPKRTKTKATAPTRTKTTTAHTRTVSTNPPLKKRKLKSSPVRVESTFPELDEKHKVEESHVVVPKSCAAPPPQPPKKDPSSAKSVKKSSRRSFKPPRRIRPLTLAE